MVFPGLQVGFLKVPLWYVALFTTFKYSPYLEACPQPLSESSVLAGLSFELQVN